MQDFSKSMDNLNISRRKERECTMSLKFTFGRVVIERRNGLYSAKHVISYSNIEAFLRRFGHLIESVTWQPTVDEEKLFQLIARYCGKTIKKLHIQNYNPYFNERNQFPVLEELTLCNAEPKTFPLDSPLKYLEIENSRDVDDSDMEYGEQSWFIREFPYLEIVRLNSVTDDTLAEFLSLNQQLRRLEVYADSLTPLIFESIGHYSKNIESLQIYSSKFDEYESSDFHEELHHLCTLRKLSEFCVSGRVSTEMLFEMFDKNNIPIRNLGIDIAPTDERYSYPTIETLNHLKCICRSDIHANALINLIKSQKTLQYLQVFNMGAHITVRTIEKILEFGKCLTDFELYFCQLSFDLKSYNRILNLAKNCVKVRIVVTKRSKIDVPTDLLKMNRKSLTIMYDD